MPKQTQPTQKASDATKVSEGKLRNQAYIWILIGFFLILCDTVLELYSTQGSSTTGPLTGEGEALRLLMRFLEAAGIAAVIFGLFNLFIELPGLRKYFLERMKELVLDQAYLGSLSEEELEKLQFNVHKAHFRNDDIAQEGGFLRFLYQDIYKYINVPYRERVTLEIRYDKRSENLFVAHDRLTYICRMSGGLIIPAILWSNDPGEIEEVQELRVQIKYPQDHSKRGEVETIGELRDDKLFYYRDRGGKMVAKAGSAGKLDLVGSELSINREESYENVDRLKVMVDAVYTFRANRFLYWLMSYPTKDFSLTLKFPDSHIVQAATFINNEHVGELTRERGYYSFSYNSWMIPQSGVAWRLIPAEEEIRNRKTEDEAVQLSTKADAV
jgi:hypothetical protein